MTGSVGTTTLTVREHPEGRVVIEEVGDDHRRIKVEAADEVFIPVKSWTTRYPLDLIDHVLAVKGAAWLCDELRRDEGEKNVTLFLHHAVLSYVTESAFDGKRLLDFGCGSGASTMILARMFPRTEIVGVELVPDMVELARHRATYYDAHNVSFEASPDPQSLPPGIGTFDFLVFNAVWEHLLPDERRTLVPALWRVLDDRGILILTGTPHRWYPLETHTTGLPLLNYVPAPLAHWAANRFSRRLPGNESWNELLRKGIRGGTEREVMKVLQRAGNGKPVLLRPSHLGARDTIDVWYGYSQAAAPMKLKAHMRRAFKIFSRMTGSTFTPYISIAIEKRRASAD